MAQVTDPNKSVAAVREFAIHEFVRSEFLGAFMLPVEGKTYPIPVQSSQCLH